MPHEFCKELLKSEKYICSISIRAKINCKMPKLFKSDIPQFEVIIYHVAEPDKILKQEWIKACCAWSAKAFILEKCHNFFTKVWFEKQDRIKHLQEKVKHAEEEFENSDDKDVLHKLTSLKLELENEVNE